MKVRYHLAVSLAGMPVARWLGGSWVCAMAFLGGGFVADLDHLADYWWHYGWRLSPSRLFRASYYGEYKKAFLPAHSWELWVAALGASLLAGGWWLWAVVGWGIHLFLDQVCNRPHPLAYFLVYRWARGFRYAELFPRQAALSCHDSSAASAPDEGSGPGMGE